MTATWYTQRGPTCPSAAAARRRHAWFAAPGPAPPEARRAGSMRSSNIRPPPCSARARSVAGVQAVSRGDRAACWLTRALPRKLCFHVPAVTAADFGPRSSKGGGWLMRGLEQRSPLSALDQPRCASWYRTIAPRRRDRALRGWIESRQNSCHKPLCTRLARSARSGGGAGRVATTRTQSAYLSASRLGPCCRRARGFRSACSERGTSAQGLNAATRSRG